MNNSNEFFDRIGVPQEKREAIRAKLNEKLSYEPRIGKSTTLNKICGYEYFRTNDIESCTKKLLSCEYKLSNLTEHYFSLCDLPGIGESIKADKMYINWYGNMLEKSACVVYTLRADQRDFSVDEEIINAIFINNKTITANLVIGLNYADKIEPVSRNYPFKPSDEQMNNLNYKVETISKMFNIRRGKIVYYSAQDGYNLDKLKEAIANAIQNKI
jgi:predicted GTPase